MSKKETLSKAELQKMRAERKVLMPHWRISQLKTSSHILFHQN